LLHRIESVVLPNALADLKRCIGTLKPYRVHGLEDYFELTRLTPELRLDFVYRCLEKSTNPPSRIEIGEVVKTEKVTKEKLMKREIVPGRKRLVVAMDGVLYYDALPGELESLVNGATVPESDG
jgi:hypothetical protein